LGRILAIDYGDARIGLALSDPLGMIASPLKTIPSGTYEANAQAIGQEIKVHAVQEVVIGMPVAMGGHDTDQTRNVRAFLAVLKRMISVPVEEIDERLSSVEATRVLHSKGVKTGHRKADVDKTAAAILLQTYLEKRQYAHGNS